MKGWVGLGWVGLGASREDVFFLFYSLCGINRHVH